MTLPCLRPFRSPCAIALPAATLLAGTVASFAPPAGAVSPAAPARAVAEWEPAYGTLIRWPLGIPYSLVRELAEDDSVYVLCETQSAENSARNAFQSNGVDLSHCRFLRIGTYSHWTRDWGPHAVFDGEGRLGITDPIFNGYPWVPPTKRLRDGPASISRGYEEDDAVNAQLAARLGQAVWAMPAYCTGGNFVTDGLGRAFSTTQMLNENAPLMTEAQFRALAEQYLGISEYTFLHGTEDVGIQHIDCWAKLLDEETILVKRVPAWHEEFPRIEQNLQILAGLTSSYGRPYRIVRIDTPPYNGYDVAAYTNSLILNRKVLVPLFGIAGDAAALQVYRDAMPGYEVLGFPGSWYYYDALHCRTMGIFDPGMLIVQHRRLDEEMPPLPEYRLTARIDDRSEAGLLASALAVCWRRQGEPAWRTAALTPMAAPDSFEARLPGQLLGTVVEYYLVAEDLSGRRETLPRTAPDGFYAFAVTTDPVSVDPLPPGTPNPSGWSAALALQPNPARGAVEIRVSRPLAAGLALGVFDATGRVVRSLAGGGTTESGDGRFVWDGRTSRGERCPAGVYWIVPATGAAMEPARLVLLP